MPAATRKSPAATRKSPAGDRPAEPPPERNPAEAAAEEAVAEPGAEFTIDFRAEKFAIRRDVFQDARFQLFFAAGRGSDLMLELLGHDRDAQDRFIATLRPGEPLAAIATEFFAAVNASSGLGNS